LPAGGTVVPDWGVARLSVEDWITYENNVRRALGVAALDEVTTACYVAAYGKVIR